MKSVFLAITMLMIVSRVSAFGLTPAEILHKSESQRIPFQSFVMDVELSAPGTAMSFRTYIKRYQALVIFLRPEKEKGKVLLGTGGTTWMFTQNTRRGVKVTQMQQLTGRAGVTYGDIMKLQWSHEYRPTLIGETGKTYELELTPRNTYSAYKRLEMSIEKGSFRPVKVTAYMKSGKKYKTIYFEGFSEINGKTMATAFKFVDHLKSDRESILTFSNVRSYPVPDAFFDRTQLPGLLETFMEQ